MRRKPLGIVVAVAAGVALAMPALALAHDDPVQSPDVVRAVELHGHREYVATHTDRLEGTPARKVLAAAGPALAADAGLPTLPTTGCPTELTTDDTAHADSTAAQVHVVYAYAADQPDSYQTFKDYAQQDVNWAQHLVAAASNGTRTVRFDMGTTCGPDYVDVTSVRLPQPLSHYQAGGDASTEFSNVTADVDAQLHLTGTHNVTIYADGVSPSGGVTGIGERASDDRAGSANDSAHGGFHAVVFATATGSFRSLTFLHETSHNLGAVQDSAPHSTGQGHCWDAMYEDIMCYPDGGTDPGAPAACSTTVYDCGGNDYFSPTPASDPYLSAHWNIYDSPFLCDVATCDPATPNTPPTAAFSVTRPGSATPVTRVAPGTAVFLDGRASHDADGALTYAWDLDGDGGTDATGAAVTHTFPNAGTFAIRLTVADARGATATVSHVLTVSAGSQTGSTSTTSGSVTGRMSALLSRLKTALRRERLRGLARGHALKVTFAAPRAGRLRISVLAGPLPVASATRTWKAAGSATVRVPPRRAVARRFVRRSKKWFTVRVTFTDRSGRSASRTAALAVAR